MRSEREQKNQPHIDDELVRYYERYSQGHDQRKETLLKALSSVGRDSKGPVERNRDIQVAWGGQSVERKPVSLRSGHRRDRDLCGAPGPLIDISGAPIHRPGTGRSTDP